MTTVVKLRQMLRVHHRTILRVVKKQQNKSSVVKKPQTVVSTPHRHPESGIQWKPQWSCLERDQSPMGLAQ